MDKLKMHTENKADINYRKLADLFPDAITETIDPVSGDVVRAIDKDILMQEISARVVEGREERYQFTWPDKKKAILAANAPIAATLRPVKEDSVGKDGIPGGWDSQNLYIEGDNLDVLKLLQETYLGKVKMIYIDPPYNTGNDFVYEDDFSEDAGEYLSRSGQYDDQGNRLEQNTESNGRFHTAWLNMIYPRIKLSKTLLCEDGVIFISIDDHEVENLRRVCDEVFGENNFVADLIWQKKFSRSNDATYFSTMHDHILCYCKNNILNNEQGWKIGLLPRGDEIPSGYGNPDNDPRGPWTSVILSAKSGSEALIYEIETPSGRKVLPPSGRYWSCSKETLLKWIADNRIWFGTDGNGTPRKKTFLSEVQQGLRPNTILFQSEVGNNQEAKQETKALFDGIGLFDGPKPVRLIKTLLQIANPEDNALILDFFSGSATTAHAVVQFNNVNKQKNRYIMVQLPEKTEENSEAYKAGYKNICEIGKERIRRAGQKIKEEAGLTASNLDIGFRVLRLDSSNMEDVFYNPDELSRNLLGRTVDNIKIDRTAEDLLFQVMLDLGVDLSSSIEERIIDGKTVYIVKPIDIEKEYLIACFDKGVTTETVTAIAKMQPYYAVFRDSGMASDSVAANFDQIFRTYSPQTERKVL